MILQSEIVIHEALNRFRKQNTMQLIQTCQHGVHGYLASNGEQGYRQQIELLAPKNTETISPFQKFNYRQ